MPYLNSFCYFLFFFLFFNSCSQSSEHQNNSEPTLVEPAPSSSNYYQEQHRPQFHFSPEANWMNDPNGMVFYEGEYHLFYQYYPDSTVWGPMHWGHAVTKDLVHWEHLPIALYPDSLGYIFSGSAVIDWNNTSGLGVNGQAPMIAIFTHHHMAGEKAKTNTFQYQSIAYSNDKGRSWTKYKGNPVVANPGIKDFRDPKVFWHKDSQKWVMLFAAYDKVRIYNSPNLIDWTYTSSFGIPDDDRLWECPDLFPLTYTDTQEGEKETVWVLITSIQQKGPNGGTATSYFLGDFDGEKFIGDHNKQYWLDYGRDNYALVSWSDAPNAEHSRLAIGWMSNWQYAQIVPTQKWRSAMTIPRRLNLHSTPEGFLVASQPAHELKELRTSKYTITPQTLKDPIDLSRSFSMSKGLYELTLEFESSETGNLVIEMTNQSGDIYRTGFEAKTNSFFSDRTKAGNTSFSKPFAESIHTAPRLIDEESIKLHLFIDHASAELFADDGTVVMTDIFFPTSPFTNIRLTTNESVKIKSGTLYELESIWQNH